MPERPLGLPRTGSASPFRGRGDLGNDLRLVQTYPLSCLPRGRHLLAKAWATTSKPTGEPPDTQLPFSQLNHVVSAHDSGTSSWESATTGQYCIVISVEFWQRKRSLLASSADHKNIPHDRRPYLTDRLCFEEKSVKRRCQIS